jgi:hypothetical protein
MYGAADGRRVRFDVVVKYIIVVDWCYRTLDDSYADCRRQRRCDALVKTFAAGRRRECKVTATVGC